MCKILSKASKSKDDEFYSPREQVECIFNRYIAPDALLGKKIWLPADSEQSQWVKYLKDNKDEWQYKEIIYTCDDFRTHKDILENVDIVITNPPFSLKKELMKMCQDAKKDFILLWPASSTREENTYVYAPTIGEKLCFCTFIRPDSSMKHVSVNILASRKELMAPVDGIMRYAKMNNITLEDGLKTGKIRIADDGKYEVKYIRNMPIDYFEWVYAPYTGLDAENISTRNLFDIKFDVVRARINGKLTYLRYLARRKKQ